MPLDRGPAASSSQAEEPTEPLVEIPVWSPGSSSESAIPPATHAGSSAGAARRLEAALIDFAFLGAINIAIVWLTLQRCGLSFAEIGVLPMLPLGGFLLLLDAFYLLMFTAASGQTVGKMAAGIRVVGASAAAEPRVTIPQAAIRALATFPSVLVLGAGFVPALIGSRLALHDRLAHTRVVRA
jgi:uncharacterized RDD family membrane protein YckC